MSIASGAVLAIDSGSPVTSVAVARGGTLLAADSSAEERSSTHLLRLVDATLRAGGVERGDLAAVVATRGPGSFTGLRVGLATALGLHQALGVRAGTVTTFAALATACDEASCLAAVDALRGEWFTQLWRRDAPTGLPQREEDPRLRDAAAIAALAPIPVTAFAAQALAAARSDGGGIRVLAPPPLAPAVLDLARAGGVDWRPESLTEPLYLRPPAALDRR